MNIPFHHAFSSLMSKGEDFCEKIAKKQREFLAPFCELQSQYKETLDDLLNYHNEIETKANDLELPVLQIKHAEEVSAMHENWFRQIESLEQQQRAKFQEFVFKLYNQVPANHLEDKTSAAEIFKPSPITANVQSLMDMGFTKEMACAALDISNENLEQSVMMLLERPGQVEGYLRDKAVGQAIKSPPKLRKSNSFFSLGRESNTSGEIRAIDWNRKRSSSFLSKAKNESPPKATNPFKNILDKAIDAFRIDGNETATPLPTVLADAFTAHVGSQQIRTMYNMQLSVKSLEDILEPAATDVQRNAIQTSCNQTLYSKKLNALVLLIRIDDIPLYGRGSDANSWFFKRCNASPELQFDSLGQQMKAIREKCINDSTKEIITEEGDFFVTKHSNLTNIQVVYHLVVKSEDEEISGRSPLVQGFRSILLLSHLCHVTQITLPILLLPQQNSRISTAVALKRIETVLKQSKGVFTELSRHSSIEHVSREIIFYIDDVTEPEKVFSSAREKIASTFRTH